MINGPQLSNYSITAGNLYNISLISNLQNVCNFQHIAFIYYKCIDVISITVDLETLEPHIIASYTIIR